VSAGQVPGRRYVGTDLVEPRQALAALAFTVAGTALLMLPDGPRIDGHHVLAIPAFVVALWVVWPWTQAQPYRAPRCAAHYGGRSCALVADHPGGHDDRAGARWSLSGGGVR